MSFFVLIYYIDIKHQYHQPPPLFLPMSFLDLNNDVKTIICKHLLNDTTINIRVCLCVFVCVCVERERESARVCILIPAALNPGHTHTCAVGRQWASGVCPYLRRPSKG